jgi:hypothetical protein
MRDRGGKSVWKSSLLQKARQFEARRHVGGRDTSRRSENQILRIERELRREMPVKNVPGGETVILGRVNGSERTPAAAGGVMLAANRSSPMLFVMARSVSVL